MNVKRYIDKAVRREIKRSSLNLRTRHIDRRSLAIRRAIRHNDGLQDVYAKLKQKAQEVIDYFKAMPTGKKVAIMISSAVAICGAIIAGHSAGKTEEQINKLENLRKAIDVNGRLVFAKKLAAAEDLKKRTGFTGPISAGAPVLSANLTPMEAKVYKLTKSEKSDLIAEMNLKTIVGLLGIFIGSAGAIVAAKS